MLLSVPLCPCTYVLHLVFRDRVNVDQTSLLPTHHAKHIPVCLYAAGRVDRAMTFPYKPAKETYEISDAELAKGMLRVGVHCGEVPDAHIRKARLQQRVCEANISHCCLIILVR